MTITNRSRNRYNARATSNHNETSPSLHHSNRSGTHPLASVSVNGNRVEFTLLRDTPNGKVSIEHSLKFDGSAHSVSIERPDFAPAARKAGKKRKAEVNVVREKAEKAPKN